jgi:hypothetical protein
MKNYIFEKQCQLIWIHTYLHPQLENKNSNNSKKGKSDSMEPDKEILKLHTTGKLFDFTSNIVIKNLNIRF